MHGISKGTSSESVDLENLLRQGQVEQVVQDCVWPGFEYLQGKVFNSVPDQLVVSDHIMAKKIFLIFRSIFLSLPYFSTPLTPFSLWCRIR